MTKKTETKTEEPQAPAGTQLETLEQRLQRELAAQALAAQGMRTSGSYISFKNAILKVDGQPVPNNTADVRVLAIVGERAWYAEEFDADQVQVPDCYALDDTAPHELAKNPQSDVCATCPKNKWGSAAKGRGKACREGARVIVVPAGTSLEIAQMSTAKVPVTSLATVQTFSSRCTQAGKLTGECITTLSVVEDKKSFFKVHLNIKEVTPIDLELLLKKQAEAYELAVTPYPVLED